jgi:hypothetical protein
MEKKKELKQLEQIISKCENIVSSMPEAFHDLENKINRVSNSHCKYLTNNNHHIYYKGFQSIPKDAYFDPEEGKDSFGTIGEWEKYSIKEIKSFLIGKNAAAEESVLVAKSEDAAINAEKVILQAIKLIKNLQHNKGSALLKGLNDELLKIPPHLYKIDIDVVNKVSSGTDNENIPPHVLVKEWMLNLIRPFRAVENVLSIIKRVHSIISGDVNVKKEDNMTKGKVYIGHGHSNIWRASLGGVQSYIAGWEDNYTAAHGNVGKFYVCISYNDRRGSA